MNLHKEMDKMDFQEKTVVTIGNFDGVHRGHEALLRKTVALAKQEGFRPLVFTFENHPMQYLYQKKIEYLNLPSRKLELFALMGVSDTVSVPFDERIMNLSTEQFAQQVLIDRLKAKHVVMGFDSRLGKGQQGKVEYLKEVGEQMGFEVHIMDPVLVDDIRVSSSHIRNLVKQGAVEKATEFLGRPYELEGIVVHGHKLGRKLGFPTANIHIDYPLVLPQKGVYFCRTLMEGQTYDVAVSVGDNPTIEDKGFSIEGHLLNFDDDLYGKTLRLYFMKHLRDEVAFDSLEGLKSQLRSDVWDIQNISLLYTVPMIE